MCDTLWWALRDTQELSFREKNVLEILNYTVKGRKEGRKERRKEGRDNVKPHRRK